MRKCPKCGAIVSETGKCGICGADLWDTRDEPLEDAVREQEASESSESERLDLKEADEAEKWALKGLFLTIVGITLTLSGLLVILYLPNLLAIHLCFRGGTCGSYGAGWYIFALGIATLLTLIGRA